MPEIQLTRDGEGKLRGWDAANDAKWQKFRKFTADLEPGECFVLEWKQPRNVGHMRKFFKMLSVGFDAWEPVRKRKTYKGKPIQKDPEAFRKDILILSGFYKQTFDLKGRMQLEAESISFANMTQERFDEVYSAVATTLIHHVLTNYTRADLDRVVESLEQFA